MVDQLARASTTSKPAPEPLIISELRANSNVCGCLLALEVQTRTTVNGKPYLHLRLRDQRGSEIIARYFDLPRRETYMPQEGKVVLLEGSVEDYRGQIQIKLARAALDESVPVELFILGTRRPVAQLESDFRQLMGKVDHPGLSALLQNCLTPEVIARFRRWPAAMKVHGAVVGGLLEHTVNVATIAEHLAQLYPCNQNLVLAGALLHDIGKLEELSEQIGADYTPKGHRMGHIVLGMQYIEEQAQQITSLDKEVLEDLLHIILAHHGTKEFGSPICPATIEALLVHQADTAEAKLTGFLDHCEHNPICRSYEK
jgi:3'-5' exoribonuclease